MCALSSIYRTSTGLSILSNCMEKKVAICDCDPCNIEDIELLKLQKSEIASTRQEALQIHIGLDVVIPPTGTVDW